MADRSWARRTWTRLEPWFQHLVWMHPEAAVAYVGWRLTEGAVRSRHVEVLKIA